LGYWREWISGPACRQARGRSSFLLAMKYIESFFLVHPIHTYF
jgi:hypothetical protein